MKSCKHVCNLCGNEWNCDFPYYSDYNFYEDAVQLGSYCNSWCPKCQEVERKNTTELFNPLLENTYLNYPLKGTSRY